MSQELRLNTETKASEEAKSNLSTSEKGNTLQHTKKVLLMFHILSRAHIQKSRYYAPLRIFAIPPVFQTTFFNKRAQWLHNIPPQEAA